VTRPILVPWLWGEPASVTQYRQPRGYQEPRTFEPMAARGFKGSAVLLGCLFSKGFC